MAAPKSLLFLLASSLLFHVALRVAAIRVAPEVNREVEEIVGAALDAYDHHTNKPRKDPNFQATTADQDHKRSQAAGTPKINPRAELDEFLSDLTDSLSRIVTAAAPYIPFLLNDKAAMENGTGIKDLDLMNAEATSTRPYNNMTSTATKHK